MLEIINNTPFNNLPIEYKELNNADFEECVFDGDKTIIQIDNNGFISESLSELVDLNLKDTSVINASVGQGKTTAIIKFDNYIFGCTIHFKLKTK